MGKVGDTVVCACVCRDSQCMQLNSFAYLQKKSDVVNKFILKDIINEARAEYCADNRDKYKDPNPQR